MNINPLAGMSVYIDKRSHDKYRTLVERKKTDNIVDYPFASMKDLFIISACTGAKENNYQEIDSSKDIFSGETFDLNIDIPLLFVLAYKKEQNIDVLLEPKKILEIAQGWANGGIDIVESRVLGRPGTPLTNFVSWLLED